MTLFTLRFDAMKGIQYQTQIFNDISRRKEAISQFAGIRYQTYIFKFQVRDTEQCQVSSV